MPALLIACTSGTGDDSDGSDSTGTSSGGGGQGSTSSAPTTSNGGNDTGGGDGGAEEGGGATGGAPGCNEPDSTDGEYGVPTSTFDLPPSSGGDLYYPDIQASFPAVDWGTLDRLYIPAGNYRLMKLGNLPVRSKDKPLVITNKGGQVKFDTDYVYTVSLNGGANWVFTGKYDPISMTGDAAFPGHKGNAYDTSEGRYGFELDGGFFQGSGPLLGVSDRATDFELSYIEILRSQFSGITAKTHDDPTATMKNVKMHDLYIHDTESEGFYIGDTGTAEQQHLIVNLELYNNRVVRTGTEAFQLGHIGPGCNIHHNVFYVGAMDWLHPFQPNYQNNNTQLTVRYGNSAVHHNLFIGGASTVMIMMGMNVAADQDNPDYHPGDVVDVHDNLFSSTKNMGAYIDPRNNVGTDYHLRNNLFGNAVFTYDYGYPAETEPSFLVVHANAPSNAVHIVDNVYGSTQPFIDPVGALNGNEGAVTASGNTNGTVTLPTFMDLGALEGIDPSRISRWFATFGPGPREGEPLVYYPGDVVRTDDLELYLCLEENDGEEPSAHPESWMSLGRAKDDFRQACDAPTAAMGLIQHAP
ncbi:MAG: hypothetical protein HOW73_12475 [Polyangiaceae bacterium]|nr:hypothetical protein [Polyangiaceae bacterium]